MMMLIFQGDGITPFTILLDRFSENISNAAPIFDEIANVFASSQAQNFGSGGGFYGYWAPLTPAYAAWKSARYPGAPILTRTGELRSSMAERPFGIEHIDDKRMVVGTALHYAKYHQGGTENMTARKIVHPPTPSELRQYGNILHRFAFQGVAA